MTMPTNDTLAARAVRSTARLRVELKAARIEIEILKAQIERGKDQFVHLVAISCIADSAEIADAAREGIRVLDS